MKLEFHELRYKREQRIEDYRSKRFIGCLRYQVSLKGYIFDHPVQIFAPLPSVFFWGGRKVEYKGEWESYLSLFEPFIETSLLVRGEHSPSPSLINVARFLHPPSLDPHHLYGYIYLPFVPSLLTPLHARKPNLWTFSSVVTLSKGGKRLILDLVMSHFSVVEEAFVFLAFKRTGVHSSKYTKGYLDQSIAKVQQLSASENTI